MAATADTGLLERDPQLRSVEELLERLTAGRGALSLVVGPAGVGKTEVLAEATRRACARGARVLRAAGVLSEQPLPFGVVRQLFESVVREAGDRQADLLAGAAGRAGALMDAGEFGGLSAADEVEMLHSLYWLCANLADQGSVLLAIDDAQWADAPSLAWLAYLARRIPDLPVTAIATVRRPDPGAEHLALQEMLAGRDTIVIEVPPLSATAVDSLIRRVYGDDVEASFSQACLEATQGNPFYLKQLLGALAADGVEPTADGAARARQTGPEAVSRAVLIRLGAIGADAGRLARSVAVLGTDVPLRRAARLAQLDLKAGTVAADLLSAAGILAAERPLRFSHPILRNAVYEDLPTGERAATHAAAARLLAAEHEPPERVATHLLAAEPAGDAEVAITLVQAARRAITAGAPASAVAYLRRALAEPPPVELRAELQARCGHAELAAGNPDLAAELLAAARAGSADAATRARITLDLSRAITAAASFGEAFRPNAFHEAAALLYGEVEALDGEDPDLGLMLEAEAAFLGGFVPPLQAQARERLTRFRARPPAGRTPGERRLLAALAGRLVHDNAPLPEVLELARRALAGGQLRAEEGRDLALWTSLIEILAIAGEISLADDECARAAAAARKSGSLTGFITATETSSMVKWVAGDLREATARASAVLDAGAEQHVFGGKALLALTEMLTDSGDLEAAEATLARVPDAEGQPDLLLLYIRGRVRLAQGRAEEAARDLLASGEAVQALELDSVALIPWRSHAGLALTRTGRRVEAAALIERELELARAAQCTRAMGMALRAKGLAEPGAADIAALEEAVGTLQPTPFRLEHARALVDRGAALRRANRRVDARESLLPGLDLAHRCGAAPLEEQAREELAALGARPRRTLLSGVESLTASERRVARLAAEGLTNKEIAQALFVTSKTVETHLRHIYQKLDIERRGQLAAALG